MTNSQRIGGTRPGSVRKGAVLLLGGVFLFGGVAACSSAGQTVAQFPAAEGGVASGNLAAQIADKCTRSPELLAPPPGGSLQADRDWAFDYLSHAGGLLKDLEMLAAQSNDGRARDLAVMYRGVLDQMDSFVGAYDSGDTDEAARVAQSSGPSPALAQAFDDQGLSACAPRF